MLSGMCLEKYEEQKKTIRLWKKTIHPPCRVLPFGIFVPPIKYFLLIIAWRSYYFHNLHHNVKIANAFVPICAGLKMSCVI